jgi:CRP-like cAMP-binding protein
MQQFSDKQEILAEGVQSDHVWVIREGKVALVQTDRATGKRTMGMILTQGDYFGVSAVMKSKSVATYQAHGSVLCIRIPAQLFERSITTPNLIGASSANSNLATSEVVQSLSQHLQQFTETLHFLDKQKQTQTLDRETAAGTQMSIQTHR